MSEPKRHHYVPRWLLRNWRVDRSGILKVPGHRWDVARDAPWVKFESDEYFCHRPNLWALEKHPLGAGALETEFFQNVDDNAKKAAIAMEDQGVQSLSIDQRRHFAAFLLSLDPRQPSMIEELAVRGAEQIKADVDNDPELLAALRENEVDMTPSEFYAGFRPHHSFRDGMLLQLQNLTYSRRYLPEVIGAQWALRRLEHSTAVLSDRPLYREGDTAGPTWFWALPLKPNLVFLAGSRYASFTPDKLPEKRFVSQLNGAMADQHTKYVFHPSPDTPEWLAKRLKRNAHNPASAGGRKVRVRTKLREH